MVRSVEGDLRRMMPGFHPSLTVLVTNSCIVAIAFFWFIIYFEFLLSTDRDAESERWNTGSGGTESGVGAAGPLSNITPEIVFVFHHPECEYPDTDAKVSAGTLDQILVRDTDKLCALRARSDPKQKESGTTRDDGPTLGSTRVALLQDLCELLSRLGFSMSVFSSVDDDEIFVCAGMDSEETQR